MSSSHVSDARLVQDILGCEEGVAQHYLKIFDDNSKRAIEAVTSYGDDHFWWGHPWNSKDAITEGLEETKDRGEDEVSYYSMGSKEPEGDSEDEVSYSKRGSFMSESNEQVRQE